MDKKRTINIEEYKFSNLVKTEDRYALLIDALFRSARLGYDEKTLSFDTGVIDLLLKTFEGNSYEKCLNQLIEEHNIAKGEKI